MQSFPKQHESWSVWSEANLSNRMASKWNVREQNQKGHDQIQSHPNWSDSNPQYPKHRY